MSDEYGYAAMRAKVATHLRVSLAYAEQTYTDEYLRSMAAEGEARGRDITRSDFEPMRCATCDAETHLTADEWGAIVDAVNAAYYTERLGGSGGSLHPRPDVSLSQRAAVADIIDGLGTLNRDRCVAARVRASAVATTGGAA